MIVTDLRIHPIAIADPPLLSSYGLHAPYALRTVIELVCSSENMAGVAETYGTEAQIKALHEARDKIIGRDVFRLGGLLHPLRMGLAPAEEGQRSQTHLVPGENPLDTPVRTYAAIETAALDLVGKALNRPVCDLFGGRIRDEIPFAAYLFYKYGGGGGSGEDERTDEYGEVLTPDSLVGEARKMVENYGFRSIKLKGGVLEPDIEIESIRALRRTFGPDVPLRIDPNSVWSVETSVAVGKALADELDGGGYLEDPTAGLDNMARVRKRLLEEGIKTPLASNVAVTSFLDLPETIRTDAVQVILSDPHYWGGLREVRHLGRVCETFGLGMSMHSNSHLGISLMTMVHAAAATPCLTYDLDTHYPWQSSRDEVVAGGKIPIEKGVVSIPDAPGLGVELDRDALARGVERYENIPIRKRDDAAEMRARVDPAWERKVPRW